MPFSVANRRHQVELHWSGKPSEQAGVLFQYLHHRRITYVQHLIKTIQIAIIGRMNGHGLDERPRSLRPCSEGKTDPL